MDLYLVYASVVFDYSGSVVSSVQANKQMFVANYTQLLKKAGKLEKVQKKYSSSEQPFMFISMTSLLTHNIAHSTMHSFRPKTNNQPIKKFLSLALSWAKVVKNWTSF